MAPNYDTNTLFSVKDLVVVITGGGSGMGAAVAQALDWNGAKAIYILGRRADALSKTAKNAKNGSIIPIVTDVSSKGSIAAAAELVRTEQGYINVLFINHGSIGPNTYELFADGRVPGLSELQSTLWQTPMEDFTSTLEINISGAFYTAVAFLDLLDSGNTKSTGTPAPKAQVIITTSIAAYSRSPANGFAYSISKCAATHIVKQLSTCLAPYMIRCNGIAPGAYPTEMVQHMPWMQNNNPRIEGNLPAQICPLKRTGTEEDIAGLAMFLMSPGAAYMNGSIQISDGGRIGMLPATY
ncbi:NAD(P)-binding protein [Pseudovirgaria hyperparasitica]|uniref:NAD(P)-binding protein n=1 Tax=Pseudovirgaria hyperparasitica TaxID=470096 RepID=A0A6A6WJX4_9PEZI|nr:NAD(P)-binding protein [Pseudovirgaria hyperparasitica]KAF2762317.1 NAD(P)-binding protein [Pseudovirgaria hyperparasitica]